MRSRDNKPQGFFQRHFAAITTTTWSFALLGAAAGKLLGIFSIIPTFGLGALAIPVLASVGFAIGAVIGFTAGCVGSLLRDSLSSNKQPIPTSAPGNGNVPTTAKKSTHADVARKSPTVSRTSSAAHLITETGRQPVTAITSALPTEIRSSKPADEKSQLLRRSQ